MTKGIEVFRGFQLMLCLLFYFSFFFFFAPGMWISRWVDMRNEQRKKKEKETREIACDRRKWTSEKCTARMSCWHDSGLGRKPAWWLVRLMPKRGGRCLQRWSQGESWDRYLKEIEACRAFEMICCTRHVQLQVCTVHTCSGGCRYPLQCPFHPEEKDEVRRDIKLEDIHRAFFVSQRERRGGSTAQTRK